MALFHSFYGWVKRMHANMHGIIEKARESQENVYLCFIYYTKAFYCVDHNKLWNAFKEMGIQDHLTCHLRNLYAGQEASVRTLYGITGSGLRKEYNRIVCCHPVYLTYALSTSWEILGWMTYKLESRWVGEMYSLRYVYDTTLMAEGKEKLKNILMKVKKEMKHPV